MFSSSIKFGFPENIIMVEQNNSFQTLNQIFSYIGVEFLGSRRFTPTCYTIRNSFGNEPLNDNWK